MHLIARASEAESEYRNLEYRSRSRSYESLSLSLSLVDGERKINSADNSTNRCGALKIPPSSPSRLGVSTRSAGIISFARSRDIIIIRRGRAGTGRQAGMKYLQGAKVLHFDVTGEI